MQDLDTRNRGSYPVSRVCGLGNKSTLAKDKEGLKFCQHV